MPATPATATYPGRTLQACSATKDHRENDVLWFYSGPAETVDLHVPNVQSHQGGYVVALEFADGTIQVSSSITPAKYVAGWLYKVSTYGLPKIEACHISRAFLLHEAVKRRLVKSLSSWEKKGSRYAVPFERFSDIAKHELGINQ